MQESHVRIEIHWSTSLDGVFHVKVVALLEKYGAIVDVDAV